ncbi:MAG TPA: hypothetical protein PK971_09710 [Saprospiraceae bacterium]|nr:hypothetical protein [Saprospiraceae bacterium]
MLRPLLRIPALLLACWLSPAAALLAQQPGLPIASAATHLLDRLAVISGVEAPFHPQLRPLARRDAAAYARQVDSTAAILSEQDQADLRYLLDDSNEWLPDSLRRPSRRALWRKLYRSPANLYEVNTRDFVMRANPILHLQAGGQGGDAQALFQNQRGLEVRGHVDGKVYFFTQLLETQARYPDYVSRWTEEYRALPGANAYKNYAPRIADLRSAYDFGIANAHIGVNVSRHVGLELGHGRHFIGNGYRSMFLSDAGAPTFYLKMNTRVWRFHYQNLFLELNPAGPNAYTTSVRLPRKYAAVHYLSFQITPRMAVGLFEATVFNRSDQFELQYLNPVILYRSVESKIGSADNALLGFDGRWNLWRRFQLYGQFLLDEFLARELIRPERSGWWGNKFALQAGLKYFNAFGIDHLDLQAEYNLARPYTWSHLDSLNSYTHYGQPLAHPLWANFREIVGIARYPLGSRWLLAARIIHARSGDDTPTQNWGTYPNLPYGTRVQDYGNRIGQGVAARTLLLGFDLSWMWRHNLYVDARLLLRTKASDDPARDLSTRTASIGLRLNIWPQNFDF